MRSWRRTAVLGLGAAIAIAATARAQAPRQDVIWARSTNGAPITLDGVLDEPAWAQAETRIIRYRYDNGIPGSGWKDEIASPVTKDSTYAVIKFLTVGNQLYMGAFVRDSSVGGGFDFNRFDGFLMALKDHSSLGRPAPPAEYLYSWWYQCCPAPPPAGQEPTFGGRWATPPWGSTARTAEQIDAWDAKTRVHGLSNSDAAADTGYTVEMRFNLTPMGYNITQPSGDVVEWNLSIYDCDWKWPTQAGRLSSNRTWWQSPWGNQMFYNEVRVMCRPDVTVSSGPVPTVGPDLSIRNAGAYPSPTVDGLLNEQVWAKTPSFDLRYGDDALRSTYPAVGPWRSGQYQPPVNASQQEVLDPADATLRWFHKGDWLYIGFDVRDASVTTHTEVDRWDGFTVSINDRSATNSDHTTTPIGLNFHVGPGGVAKPEGLLAYLRDTLGTAQLQLQLKAGTTADTAGTNTDTGYTAELGINLTALGYPSGLGDRSLFVGVDLYDGDDYTPWTFSYATRVWYFREFEGTCCPATAYLDPNLFVVGVEDPDRVATLSLAGARPNPFRRSTSIAYTLPAAARVRMDVFDLLGRRVTTRDFGLRPAGPQQTAFHALGLRSGLYLYRLQILDPADESARGTLSGKLMLVP